MKERTKMKHFSSYLTQLKFFSNFTGKFPVQPYRRNNYILVTYPYDENNTLKTALKNRSGHYILSGIKKPRQNEKAGINNKATYNGQWSIRGPKNILKNQTYSSNWCQHTYIREILPNGQWENSIITSFTNYVMCTLYYPYTYGTTSYPK